MKQPDSSREVVRTQSPQTSESHGGRQAAELRRLVAAGGRRLRTALVLHTLAIGLATPLAYLWLVFFLDNRLHFSLAARAAAAVGLLLVVAWAIRFIARRSRWWRLSEDQVALAIEQRTPGGVENRLINALQLARGTAPQAPELSAAVVEENCHSLKGMALAQPTHWRPVLARVAAAAVVVLGGLGYFLWQPALFANAASRIFMPLAQIEPLYRTKLNVQPGSIEAAGDVEVSVEISGERPRQLVLRTISQGQRKNHVLPVPPGNGPVRHTLHELRESLDYAVSGGDFTSPYYRIEVPQATRLVRLEATLRYPSYTGLAERRVESTGGQLEALEGAEASLVFHFNQPLEGANLLIKKSEPTSGSDQRIALKAKNGITFTTQLALAGATGYALEVHRRQRAPELLGPFAVHLAPDAEPKLELRGLELAGDVEFDTVLPLTLSATDDFGLSKVGLFYRVAAGSRSREAAGETPGTLTSSATSPPPWQEIAIWPGDKHGSLKKALDLTLETLAVAEGDRLELAPRAIDNCPSRGGAWVDGPVFELSIGGAGAQLQRQYEQILQTERELAALVAAHNAWLTDEVAWLRKLEASELRWDDPQNVAALHSAVAELGKRQESLRTSTGAAARAMVEQAGNLRIGLALLADTEHVRMQRILASVPARDEPQVKQAALTDAQVTHQRVIRSLEEIQSQYALFRADWELNQMLPLTHELAEQQSRLAQHSRRYAAADDSLAPGERALAKSMTRRQTRVREVCDLIQPAFVRVAAQLNSIEPELSAAFSVGGEALAGQPLKQQLQTAGEASAAARWSDAATAQTEVAELLAQVCDRIRAAQSEAARKALAALEEKAKSDALAQAELEALMAGSAESGVKDVAEIELRDLMRVRDVVAKKSTAQGSEELDLANAPLFDVQRSQIERNTDSGVRQNPYSLSLGNTAEKTAALGVPLGQEQNQVKPFIQEEFDDLVGKLLEEADELHKNFETINLNTNQNNDDPGDIGKQGGRINSTGAVTATGNKKPPTTNIGGVSRTGRQGARAHGMIADETFINRRGRDQAQEGQEEVADQEGRSHEQLSDDPQLDSSTGIGGKRVDSDDSNFSLADVGKWKDEFAARMEKPQAKHNIVERAGEPIDAEAAALLRDMNSKQEQVIERLKVLRKELKNLYLPTEHLDELASTLAANLDRLKERPDPDLFRLQSEQLQRLHGALRVFQGPAAGLEPSLPRERKLLGRVLDEPSSPGIPGYEEAVKQYFLNLAHE